jgi:sodium bicarbonate transporter 10
MDLPHDDEASKDPAVEKAVLSFDEDDFEGHRAHSVFVGVHIPGERKHSHRRHRHHHRDSFSGAASQDNRPSK